MEISATGWSAGFPSRNTLRTCDTQRVGRPALQQLRRTPRHRSESHQTLGGGQPKHTLRLSQDIEELARGDAFVFQGLFVALLETPHRIHGQHPVA